MKIQIGLMVSVCCLIGCNSPGINFLGGKKQKVETVQSEDMIVQSETIFARELSAVEKSRARNTTIEGLYDSLLIGSSDKSFVVDGIKLSGVRSNLIEMKPLFDSLAKRYGNFGEMLDHLGADLDSKPSPAEARISFEETADLLNGSGFWGEFKDIIASGQLDLGIEPEIAYEDMGLTQGFHLLNGVQATHDSQCAAARAVSPAPPSELDAAMCTALIVATDPMTQQAETGVIKTPTPEDNARHADCLKTMAASSAAIIIKYVCPQEAIAPTSSPECPTGKTYDQRTQTCIRTLSANAAIP